MLGIIIRFSWKNPVEPASHSWPGKAINWVLISWVWRGEVQEENREHINTCKSSRGSGPYPTRSPEPRAPLPWVRLAFPLPGCLAWSLPPSRVFAHHLSTHMPLFRVPLSLPIQFYPTWHGSHKTGFLTEKVQMQVGLRSDPDSPMRGLGLSLCKNGAGHIPTFQACCKVMLSKVWHTTHSFH